MPFYLRILYVFLTYRKYRSRSCFQLMIQQGIAQSFMAPSSFLFGLAIFLDRDPYGISAFTEKLSLFGIVEVGLNLVLAMDRLNIICNLNIPSAVFQILTILSWLFGFFSVSLMLLSLAGLKVDPPNIRIVFDFAYPYSELFLNVFSYTIYVCSSVTFLLYVIIVIFLIQQAKRMHSFRPNYRQKFIFIQAFVKHVSEIVVIIGYQFFVHTSDSSILNAINAFGFYFYNLALPPLLYLALNKDLRANVFGLKDERTSNNSRRTYMAVNSL
ncbi:hypothetical protein L596_029444 [Steinernema carpocapsae]|uniref:7TM GPCR serpentine receptor class x (Srx) domain-containing protein n=1 Tax=Steinernema carpocapsae TaxID=34508 RepID=A0A4U5LUN3_STECR|nr:hypothetical protein L596_029444 [Steinernema carpocapsae]